MFLLAGARGGVQREDGGRLLERKQMFKAHPFEVAMKRCHGERASTSRRRSAAAETKGRAAASAVLHYELL